MSTHVFLDWPISSWQHCLAWQARRTFGKKVMSVYLVVRTVFLCDVQHNPSAY